jgi:hypothetical protein
MRAVFTPMQARWAVLRDAAHEQAQARAADQQAMPSSTAAAKPMMMMRL